MNRKREEKALVEFKQIMENLLVLLCKATEAQTGYLYWVNRKREQFVLETSKTSLSNVKFNDRIAFEKYFLDDFKNIKDTIQLEVGRDLNPTLLEHHYERPSIQFVTIIPFQNNGETVALTVLESAEPLEMREIKRVLAAYNSSHINVLNTYLELTDLHQDEQKWADYDESLAVFNHHQGSVDVLHKMLVEMQKIIPTGGIIVAARGMSTWVTILRSMNAPSSPELGLMVEEKSLAYESLQKGEPLFSIHFNQNPKRISTSEVRTEGATYAMPMLIRDRRHAVILAYDKNPLVFKESVKHQLNNLVRIASLAIKAELEELGIERDLYTTEYGDFREEAWRLILENQMQRARESNENIWFGMIGIDNLSALRSRYRLEDLKKLQRMMVKALNPARLGYNGLIGHNSDYVFTYIFNSSSEEDHSSWIESNIADLKNKLDLGDERKVEVHIKAGFIKTGEGRKDVNLIVNEAKQALNMAMTNKDASYVNI